MYEGQREARNAVLSAPVTSRTSPPWQEEVQREMSALGANLEHLDIALKEHAERLQRGGVLAPPTPPAETVGKVPNDAATPLAAAIHQAAARVWIAANDLSMLTNQLGV